MNFRLIIMRIFLNRMLIAICVLFLQSHAFGQNNSSCEMAKRIVSDFVNSKRDRDWRRVEDDADKLQNCKCEMAPVFYYIYRMKVLLPNSQVLKGISPNDFILSQKLKMNEQVNSLNVCEKGAYMPLIRSMMNQDFDSEVSNAANELNKELISK